MITSGQAFNPIFLKKLSQECASGEGTRGKKKPGRTKANAGKPGVELEIDIRIRAQPVSSEKIADLGGISRSQSRKLRQLYDEVETSLDVSPGDTARLVVKVKN